MTSKRKAPRRFCLRRCVLVNRRIADKIPTSIQIEPTKRKSTCSCVHSIITPRAMPVRTFAAVGSMMRPMFFFLPRSAARGPTTQSVHVFTMAKAKNPFDRIIRRVGKIVNAEVTRNMLDKTKRPVNTDANAIAYAFMSLLRI